MIQYTQKYKKYIGFIKAALQNKNIDSEDHEWELNAPLQALISPQASLALTNSVSLGIESSELLLLIRIKDELPSLDNISGEIANEIKKNVKNYQAFDTFNIIWIFDSIKIKIKLRYEYSEIVNHVKNELSHSPKFLSTYYVDKDICAPEIKLNNTKRLEMLLLPPLEPNVHVQETTNSIKSSIQTI